MRKLCPNYDIPDGLDTVLEVPIPEEMFVSNKPSHHRSWQNMKSWMNMKQSPDQRHSISGGSIWCLGWACAHPEFFKPYTFGFNFHNFYELVLKFMTCAHPEIFMICTQPKKCFDLCPPSKKFLDPPLHSMVAVFGGRNTEIQLLLGVIGAPLIPLPINHNADSHSITKNIKDQPIEASMAKYIVKQYIAAVGGEKALGAVDSMYAMGKVRMAASEFSSGEGSVNNKIVKARNLRHGDGEVGGFVLWQKRPELWCLELVVSGCKISAGSDGKVAWRQTPWHHSHASRGPPRPLRRFLQGLDPRSTANLFANSVCIGEKTINGEDCFILKLEAEPPTLRARSSSNVEIIRHTVWGCFSQRTGLLIQLEDSHLLRINSPGSDGVFWETTMESLIQDYRTVDGVNIAHAGKTSVLLFRFGENSESHSRTRMEEVWTIEEIDFNIKGLSTDCFLPPGDLKKEEEGFGIVPSNVRLPFKLRNDQPNRVKGSKVVAIDDDERYDDESSSDDDDLF